ncbi:MAG TPA: hypothetical protein VKE51_24075 [Vicinamibacterales bacterium]|nr:hypothetical protein [Vicinamibacterales bacterium]
MSFEPTPAYSGFQAGQAGRAYNEAAFRHFLAIDQWQAARSRRSVLLVLVSLRRTIGGSAKLTDDAAAAIFKGLGDCVREIDFVGWFREGYVAAAVLVQANKPSGDPSHLLAGRILPAIRRQLSAEQARRLRVRIVRLAGGKRN